MSSEQKTTGQDYTDQIKAQISMLQELIRRSSLGYHSIDINGIVVDVNEVWLKTLGYKKEEVLGHWFGNFVHEDYREKFLNNFPKLREKGIIENLTFFMKHKDGSAIELVFNGMIEKDSKGEFVKTHSAFHRPDSARITLEDRIYESFEEKIISKSRLELMGEMINAIAHQWRQPLNALGLIIQDTEEVATINGIVNPEIKENTASGMELILRMSSTIDEFRDFFTDETASEHVNLADTAMESLNLVFSQMNENSIDFSVICECSKNYFHSVNEIKFPSCPDHNRYVMVNRQELKQVLLNIISNARHAMRKAILSGAVHRGKLDFHIFFSDDTVRLNISNNGAKIPEETLLRVFEPYYTTKSEGEGVGLGMYMCKILVEKHMKGTISIENSDEGVVVSMTLPSYNITRSQTC